MRKLVLSLLCLLALGSCLGYIGGTLSLGPTQADGSLRQTINVRRGNSLVETSGQVELMPCRYPDSFAPETVIAPLGTANWQDKLWSNVRGAKDQMVQVKNLRDDTPCYFRSYIAFENTSGVYDEFIFTNWNDKDYSIASVGNVVVDGVSYHVYEATYRKALAAGATAAPSLLQIAMRSEADNRDIAVLNGGYDVIAASEAVWADLSGDDEADAAENAIINSPDALNTYLGQANMEHIQTLLKNT